MPEVRTRILSGFDDPACGRDRWTDLLRISPTNAVFLTWEWQRAWWETHGAGELLIVAAERDGEVIALAPFYFFDSCLYLVGSGEADYHDLIGDVSDPQVVAALICTAREACTGIEDMKLYVVPQQSPTSVLLAEAAGRLGLQCTLMDEYPAVELDLAAVPEAVRLAVSRSMLEKEDYFRRHGELRIRTWTEAADIRPLLAEFYAHHVNRWMRKSRPSEFVESKNRRLLERFLELAADTGWIRYLQIEWKGKFLAAEFAWYYQGTHFAGPWCFDVAQANHSPGRVLLRNSILAALSAGLCKYDFGGGAADENFRLPVRLKTCQTWGIYPP